jgi:hypothetical protein
MSKTIAGRMADAAQADAGLPMSLVCDAWDLLEGRPDSLYVNREDFTDALILAVDEYEANPAGYVFNLNAVVIFADTIVEPASISKAVIGVDLVNGEPVWSNF